MHVVADRGRGEVTAAAPPAARVQPNSAAQLRWPLATAWLGIVLIAFNRVEIATLPISDLVFFALAGVIWLLMLTGRADRFAPSRFRRSSPRILALSMMLVLFATISSFRSWDPADSMNTVVRLGYLTMLWFWMLRCLSVNRRTIAVLLRAWRWGVVITSVAVILANAGAFKLGVPNAEGRQTGWFGHPNDLGGYLAVSIPLFVMATPVAVTERRQLRALWRPLMLALVVFAMSTAGSMSAFLGAAAGTLAAGFAYLLTVDSGSGRRRATHPLKLAGLVLLGVVGIAALARTDTPLVQRFTRLGEGDAYVSGSIDSRTDGNEQVINSFDQVLVLGRGLDSAAQQDLDLEIGVHNMYLKLVYEGGFIAALALVLILVFTLHQAWRLLLNTRSTMLHRDICAVAGTIVAAIVFANFQPTTIQRFFWLPVAMMQCYWTLRRTELAGGLTEDELNDWADPGAARSRPGTTPA